jgi:PhnB protein
VVDRARIKVKAAPRSLNGRKQRLSAEEVDRKLRRSYRRRCKQLTVGGPGKLVERLLVEPHPDEKQDVLAEPDRRHNRRVGQAQVNQVLRGLHGWVLYDTDLMAILLPLNVQTYLFFDDCCREAIELYQQAMSAEVLFLSLFSEAPEALRSPERDDLVFHSTLRIGETLLNLSDDPFKEKGHFGGFALLLHLDSAESVETVAEQLCSAGHMDMPPQAVPWASRYAIVTDRFGVTWKLQYSA